MQESIIKIENLKKRYKLGSIGGSTLKEEIHRKLFHKNDGSNSSDEFWALNGISLDIKQGERIGIIGSNGAGKSTMLKILSRVTSPTEGCVTIRGRITSMLEIGTGFHGELTGRQNIYMNGAILGMPKEEIDRKIEEIIDFSECREFIDTPVKRYSSGMYVKLAFSVAAHLDSEIMIMDEVLAVGDVAFQRKCLDKMASVSEKEGKTILYVSHNMSTIRRLCDRCIVLEKGQLVFDGEVEEAIQRYMKIGGEMKKLSKVTTDMRDMNLNYDMDLRAEIKEIELISHESNYVDCGEKIKLKTVVCGNDDVDEVYYRCIIYKMDGSPVGTAMSDSYFSISKDEYKTLELEFDTSQIAPGKYSMTMILFKPDYCGGSEKYDAVSNALLFEVVTTKNQFFNYQWTNGWGNSFYPIEMKEL